ncbi:MurR/RpiR family transcriptional regulator [Thermoanaerobacter thermohydrosulfuricus]|uniref:MurR/RpiR family transcriptional regulator n=1 Tax=Thermoanaerobacter indiensis TaxID=1125974 RepID=UPI00037E5BE3|nr:MurR/RpiR family transcriptional regulator [Thermoanaerobacter indiensis]
MTDILAVIKELQITFKPSEAKIAKYILDNADVVTELSINELAKACDTSEASIVRFCRTIGLKGFQELKIKIAVSLSKQTKKLDGGITDDDDVSDVIQKIANFNKQAIDNTISLLDVKSIIKAVDALSNANKIDFYGVAASGTVAYDAMLKFSRINIPCTAYQDSHLQLTSAVNLKKGDVACGISYSGATKEIVEAIQVAKEAGATTISLTKYGQSPLVKTADINLFVSSEEAMFRSGAMASRIAQLTVIDILFILVARKKYNEVVKYLENTSEILSMRKIYK